MFAPHSAALQFSETCEHAVELKLSVKHACAFYCTLYSAMSHKLCLNIIVHLMSPDENYTQCSPQESPGLVCVNKALLLETPP